MIQRENSRTGFLLLWIFVLSGFSGLIYQSIWTQYLGLFLGHSAYAQSLVLILFMGGMTLGAWLVSRYSESLRRPLLAYALIELAIGLTGLLFDRLYQAGTGWAYASLMTSVAGGAGIKWTMAVALVLPQCVLLGATFPLMSAGFMRLQPAAEGRVLAGLYFSNSIGAAAGALAATYLLLPRVGLPGAVMTAGLLNVLVAIAVYPVSKIEATAPLRASAGADGGRTTPLLVLVLGVACLTGATSFVYEITWIRMLSLALGTTIHAFELMLAAFISGIAFGGLWLRNRADRLASPLATAGWVQVWMGLAALASMFVYANAFEWVGWLMRVIAKNAEGYGLYNLASGAIALLVMFPAAFFAGMTLPLLTLALLRAGSGERAIGRVYAVNTLGAIVGVLLATHVLLPAAGLKLALWAAAAADLALGVLLLWRVGAPAGRRLPAPAMAAALSLAGLALAMGLVRFDPLVLASSVYRSGAPTLGDARMLFYKDGKTATVAVHEHGEGGRAHRSISTNGKVDAGLMMGDDAPPGGDEYTMALAAALPLSMRESYGRVGVIGFGSGMTTHSLLGSPRVERVDTVEIEPAMIEGARLFGPRVRRAYEDPRSHIVIDDAKSYFSSAGVRYDLIVSEPSNPWMGGTASLFSREFYAFVPRHLSADGLFVQWLQMYEIDPVLVASVLRAMLPHFNDVQAYASNTGDLLLIASPHGMVPAPGDHLFGNPQLDAELHRLGIDSARDLQDGFVMDRTALAAYAGLYQAPANSDFFPFLQLNAPRARFMLARVDLDPWLTAPWPLARRMAGIEPRPLQAPLPESPRAITLDGRQRAARELRAIMVEGDPAPPRHATPTEASQARALRSLAQACQLDADAARNTHALAALAVGTMTHLDAAARQDLWTAPTWLGCAPQAPAVSGMLALLSAASRDDHAGVLAAGQALLDGPGAAAVAASPLASYYVAGALQFAAWSLGDAALARGLMDDAQARLHPAIRQDAVIRLLHALAAGEIPPDTAPPPAR